ncbi:uncharacterized protein FMAN_05484 [Fusarium mangiferae]|uniref:Uncharacterized protein n=1 Tax=Fusarium mangiferae TaxID=192010 RepID=A0A1L7SLY1_FUSMA|nr:uncharacterized protein FMAN_05484 [Fusarium mangiferae]CVK87568.1 uncharacterized protein FMAN_05484 [Fusarium mangiferae]
MTSQPATPSAIAVSGEDVNGDTVNHLRQRLHEAEHTITGLKATQDFVVAQNAELKKENNQLREDMAVLRCQNSRAGNSSNEAITGGSVTMSPEDLKKLQGILQEVKRHGSELHQKAGELRDSVLLKQEEFSRKRRRTDSDTDKNEEESPATQFVKSCKQYNTRTTRCTVAFQGAIKPFIEDLSHAYEPKSSLPHEKIRRNLADFAYSRNKPGWHCLRQVCEKGKLSTEAKSFSVCALHGSDCEFLIWKQQSNPGNISFTAFGEFENSAK